MKIWTKLTRKITAIKGKKANKKIKSKDLKEYLKYVIQESDIYEHKDKNGLETKFLYDFISERYNGTRWGGLNNDNHINIPETRMVNGFMTRGLVINGDFIPQEFNGTQISIEDKDLQIKIEVKPIDIIGELERVPSSWSTVGIDEKIIILKEKSDMIKNNYAKKEVDGMVERLNNRKKYFSKSKSGETFKEFFTKFDSTTEEKVNDIIVKYPHLTVKDSDLFIPEFPDIAIQTMKNYTEKCMELCGKKPIYQVIAPVEMFKDKVKQRDPILLVQSPFGYYFDILGAWDAEMILLSEL